MIKLMSHIARLPQRPGVYQFLDRDGHLLYIGKATHLRPRVQSYFRRSTPLSDAKRRMVAQICSLKTIVVDTEVEALLLETTLIKQHKPPYNVVMKDDKNFQYIHITDEPFPRVETARSLVMQTPSGHVVKKKGLFFGPYTSGLAVRRVLHLLQEIFHYCTMPPVTRHGKLVYPQRPCLEYHLGRCVGPCARTISPREYQRMMHMIARFLQGAYAPIEASLQHAMQRAAMVKNFERAAVLRDQLQAIAHLMVEQKVISPKRESADFLSLARVNGTAAVNVFTVRSGKMIGREVFFLQHTTEQTDTEIFAAFQDQYYAQTVTKPRKIYTSSGTHRGKIRKLLVLGKDNALQTLRTSKAAWEDQVKRAQQGLQELAAAIGVDAARLRRIEIYDISNVQGNYSVGSMVVFTDGQPHPAQYRKFKIKTVSGPNDFASLQEVLERRLRRVRDDDAAWPRPDLLIIDGGKGQLRSATTVLAHYQLGIPVIALAKREEEVFLPARPNGYPPDRLSVRTGSGGPGRASAVRLPKNSQGLFLLQRMRDEAHRFAIGFYRRRHLKDLVSDT